MADFLLDIPPVTKLLMLHQLVGLGIQYGDYFSRYDLYFDAGKIFAEGEVRYVWKNTDDHNVGVASVHFALLLQEGQLLFLLLAALHVPSGQFRYHMLKNLERGFNRGSVDFLFNIVLILGTLYALAFAFSIGYLGIIFKYVIYYLFGRTNSEHFIMINLIPMRAPFLIWYSSRHAGCSSSSTGSWTHLKSKTSSSAY